MVELTDGRVAVREWLEEDAWQLVRLADDRRVWMNLRDAFPHPYGIEDARAFIAMSRKMTPQTFFAITVAGALAGGIGYVPGKDVERIGAEVGYWIGHPYWGQGIATAALRFLTTHAFGANPHLERLFAVPYVTNGASVRVLEKAGFRREGVLRRSAIKDGQVLDQYMYALLREGEEIARSGG